MTTIMALGGSTNAIIHIVAMSKRAGLPMSLQRFDDISRTTPVLANIKPSGEFLMEEFDNQNINRLDLSLLLQKVNELLDNRESET